MARDATPPHITALFDQQAATQHEQDQLPDGVVAQIRVRRVNISDESTGLAASFNVNLEDHWQAAHLLLTLEGVAAEFASDVARSMAQLMTEGPEGFVEALAVLKVIQDGRQATPARVKRSGDTDE